MKHLISLRPESTRERRLLAMSPSGETPNPVPVPNVEGPEAGVKLAIESTAKWRENHEENIKTSRERLASQNEMVQAAGKVFTDLFQAQGPNNQPSLHQEMMQHCMASGGRFPTTNHGIAYCLRTLPGFEAKYYAMKETFAKTMNDRYGLTDASPMRFTPNNKIGGQVGWAMDRPESRERTLTGMELRAMQDVNTWHGMAVDAIHAGRVPAQLPGDMPRMIQQWFRADLAQMIQNGRATPANFLDFKLSFMNAVNPYLRTLGNQVQFAIYEGDTNRQNPLFGIDYNGRIVASRPPMSMMLGVSAPITPQTSRTLNPVAPQPLILQSGIMERPAKQQADKSALAVNRGIDAALTRAQTTIDNEEITMDATVLQSATTWARGLTRTSTGAALALPPAVTSALETANSQQSGVLLDLLQRMGDSMTPIGIRAVRRNDAVGRPIIAFERIPGSGER